MAKRMMALVLTLMMLVTQCVSAQAAQFATWNKGTILMDPVTFFGSDKYRFVEARDDRDATFSWNWVTYVFHSKGSNVQMLDGFTYVKMLEATGFFEVVKETSKNGRWEVRYIGKEKKLKVSKSGSSPEGKWHVLVISNAGVDENEFRVLLVDGIEFCDIDNPKNEKSYSPGSAANKNSKSNSSSGKSSSSSSSKNSSSSSSSGKSSSSSSVSKTRTKRCTKCSGDGKVSCSRCSGSGGKYVYVSSPNYSGKSKTSSRKWENCSKCRGSGTQSCGSCGGDGKVEY